MDPGNAREALRECALDLDEGADMLMVKPALPVPRRDPRRERALRLPGRGVPGLRRVRDGAAAAAAVALDERAAALETLTAIRRAGASMSSPTGRRRLPRGSERSATEPAWRERDAA